MDKAFVHLQHRDPFPAALKGAVAAIGNFDGVHRGHQMLLREAQALAAAKGASFGVISFEPHPRSFFRPAEPVFRLTPEPLKARLVKALGADFLLSLRFDAELASQSPEEFVRSELSERAAVSHVVTGYDFHFGHKRKGSPETMRTLGSAHGFATTVVEQVTDDDGFAPFSSSTIRASLRHGRVTEAARDLGYLWTVLGEVVHGDKRGRTIGFPTINIIAEPGTEPCQGIYAVRVRDTSAPGTVWNGAGYFGKRPTFDSDRTFLEVFLLDYSGDLYGRTMLVEFVNLIRPDQKFMTLDALVSQMTADCVEARRLLAAEDAAPVARAFQLGELQARGLI